MHFLDGSLFPENQQKLVITAAPYGPEWLPSDFPEEIAVTMDEQVQKAVDCYNAGATVLHVHVREADGKGSKRLSQFNELLARLRIAVPDMVLQVGGSISFSPENEGDKAKWLSDDTRHMLAELTPKPDQVTVTVNTSQMNIVEQMEPEDIAGTSLANPAAYEAFREMIVPGGPGWAEEHVKRLTAAGIQSAFQFYNINSFETVERMIRRGIYKGPLVMNWVAIGGGWMPEYLQPCQFPARHTGWVDADPRKLNAKRVAGQSVRDCAWASRSMRHRRQYLDAGSQSQVRNGEAGRATRAHCARGGSAGGDRQGGAAHLQDWRVLRQR